MSSSALKIQKLSYTWKGKSPFEINVPELEISDGEKMRLLGQKNSINVRKVLWTCAELELVPQLEDWGGNTRDTSDPEFLKLNPKGLVPVLVDDGRVFSESNSICRYLAATQKRTDLLPQTPELRAEVEAWISVT